MPVLYVDVDGTLVGPGGDLLWNGSTRLVEALLAARRGGVEVVPVSGRGPVQVFELCRLLGLPRGIGELGCVHVDVAGHQVRYELGRFPFSGVTPVEAMHGRGAVAAACALGLEPHEPWNEGREATYLLRGRVHLAEANAAMAAQGFGWCELVDNGELPRRGRSVHAYHLAPAGTGKASGVRADRLHHGRARDDTTYVGDSASDLACAPEVGRLWLVSNADPELDWPHRTTGAYGDGVAEVLRGLLAQVR
ncbi:MAG: HAD family hydrolase [Acidimicrobiia bacterium]